MPMDMDPDPFDDEPPIEGRSTGLNCVHTIPVPAGWSVEESVRWAAQGLRFPEYEDATLYESAGEFGGCDICVRRTESS